MGGSVQSRVLVLGLDNAGKTTFLNKAQFPKKDIDAQPTESYQVLDVKVKGVKLNVWDVSGKPTVRSLWASYYKEGGIDAIIWVIDSADTSRFEESKKVLQAQLRDPQLQGKMLFVVANKNDLDGAASKEEIASALKLATQDGKRTCEVVTCSSKTGKGVKEAMSLLAKDVKEEVKSPRGER
eukprot:TRINITY_DN5189_c0_g1_i1.p1 TRINITY_DN5189_c0_g1~~TRINITY_DN5189_c0_g1_i1.p1  ORF type:complete len:182 (-),score=58.22 TRINITY_DN5189_c0_g1_i1:422-967(-)